MHAIAICDKTFDSRQRCITFDENQIWPLKKLVININVHSWKKFPFDSRQPSKALQFKGAVSREILPFLNERSYNAF